MLRMLLADDDPVFLSKLERLLTQYAAQQQRKVWIDAYPRAALFCSPMILPFWTLISETGAAPELIWRGGCGRKEMTQSSFLLPTMWNMHRRGMNCARSGIF